MPRRFALLLVALLLALVGALFLARHLRGRVPRREGAAARPTPAPTPVVPPTPIAARRVVLYFESPADGKLHPESRDLPVMADDIALLRAVGAAVLEGPRGPDLLSPFPEGWRLRAAFRLKDGIAVLDLEPPGEKRSERPPGASPARWETGSREELLAAQALVISAARNTAGLGRLVLLVGGEPAETLGGHVDLRHPLVPDPALVSEEPAASPAPPAPTSAPTPAASPAPGATPTPRPGGRSRADSA
jgi:hypothetical protein